MKQKSICKKYSTHVGRKLEPEQLAVGTPSGIHNKMITIRIQQEKARLNQNDNDPQKKIIASTLDFVNAHNVYGRCKSTKKLIKLQEEDPYLKPLVQAILSVMECNPEIFVHTTKGLNLLCYSEEGGAQGNPLTNLAFAITIDDALKNTTAKFPEVMIRAIQDDVTIIGPRNQIEGDEGAWEFLKNEIFEVSDCVINPRKSKTAMLSKIKETDLENLTFIEIEGKKLYGMEVCGIPIGEDDFIQHIIDNTANIMVNKIKSLSTRLANLDAQAAWSVLKLSLQNIADYVISIVEPSYTNDLIQKVDEALINAYSIIIGSDVKGNTETDPNFTMDRLKVKAKLGGGGLRPLKDRYSFINSLNNVIPKISQLCPTLQQDLGTFSEDNNRWETFLNSSLPMSTELMESWEKIRTQTREVISSLTSEIDPNVIKTISEDPVNLGRNCKKNLSNKIANEIQQIKKIDLDERAERLPIQCPRRLSYLCSKNDEFANTIFTASPVSNVLMTSSEFQEAACNHLGLPSPLMVKHGECKIQLKGKTITTDPYGRNIKTVTGVKGGHRTVLHNDIHSTIGNTIKQAGIQIKGKLPETCANMFSHLINCQITNAEDNRLIQGIIPDLVINANPLIPGTDPHNTVFDGKNSICDVKTLGPGKVYLKRNVNQQTPVDIRQEQVHREYLTLAKALDRKYNGITEEGQQGPIENEIQSFGNNGKVIGLVVGNYAECSTYVHQLVEFISKNEAFNQISICNPQERESLKAKIARKIITLWGLTFHRGWARLLIERTALLIRRDIFITDEDITDEEEG